MFEKQTFRVFYGVELILYLDDVDVLDIIGTICELYHINQEDIVLNVFFTKPIKARGKVFELAKFGLAYKIDNLELV